MEKTNKIVNQINKLSEIGYKEIVLTGTQLGSYGFEFKNMWLDDEKHFSLTLVSKN